MLTQNCALGLLLLMTACGSPRGGAHTDAVQEVEPFFDAGQGKSVEHDEPSVTPYPASAPHDAGPPLRFVPSWDANADVMGRIDVAGVQEATFTRPGYFKRYVPRLVHRVLGPTERPGAWPEFLAWRSYCDAMGFELIEWNPLGTTNRPQATTSVRAQAFLAARAAGRPDVAVQLTALAVLAKHGGFLIGPQVLPPTQLGCAFDLQDMGNRQGLTIATNLRARRVGGWSVYLTTALMVASPQHPWVVAASTGAAVNTLALLGSPHAHLAGRYFAGNAYLSRNLAGIFSMLPFTYLQELGMFPAPGDELTEEDALE